VDFHAPCTLVNHHVKALYKYKMQYCGIDVDWRERTNLHAGRRSVMSSQKNKRRKTNPVKHRRRTTKKQYKNMLPWLARCAVRDSGLLTLP
jgi:hypothetical protein